VSPLRPRISSLVYVAVAHLFTLRNGRVITHTSYPDTARYVAALAHVAA